MRTINKVQDAIYPATGLRVVQGAGSVVISTTVEEGEQSHYIQHTFSLEEFEEIAKGVIEDLEKKRATNERLDKLKIETDADYKAFNKAYYEEMDKKVNIVDRPFIPYEQMIINGCDKGWFVGHCAAEYLIQVETSTGIQPWKFHECVISSVRKSGKNYNAPCRVSEKTFDELR